MVKSKTTSKVKPLAEPSESEEELLSPASDEELTGGSDVEDEDEEVPLSDLESLDQKENDIVPTQRQTINNRKALEAAVNSIRIDPSTLPYSELQIETTAENVEIKDINDDLNRELAFYTQGLHAAKSAKRKLLKEGVAFSRPDDYFAEMIKSDAHMDKVRDKLVQEAQTKQASEEAKRQRTLKKFGKQVQVNRQLERQKQKRENLDKIKNLKRKREGGMDLTKDDFNVALDNDQGDKRQRSEPSSKMSREKKNAKFGFGGKKRYSKSNDFKSTIGAPKSKPKGKAPRPGKSKRHKS